MPNNVINTVIVRGSKGDLESIIKLMRGKTAFDFHKIIPQPRVFRGVITGSTTIDGQSVTVWREKEVGGQTVQKAIRPAVLQRWQKRYGATNWYNWNIKNWGTKWPAYEVDKKWRRRGDSEMAISFMTAWSDPRPVLEALHRLFPNCSITLQADGEVDEPYSYTLRHREAV